ncbi:hypothetical protein BC830DRAFT_1147341 [Chytriomyces sp. MP71]|nr:hypothetical protein BC830DRAFT_1147341 [Chytriomyces sp. MP71]
MSEPSQASTIAFTVWMSVMTGLSLSILALCARQVFDYAKLHDGAPKAKVLKMNIIMTMTPFILVVLYLWHAACISTLSLHGCDESPANIVFTAIMFANVEVSYLLFSWLRNGKIIALTHPHLHPHMRKFVIYLPALLYVQVIPAILEIKGINAINGFQVTWLHDIMNLAGGGLVCLFDCVLLYSFLSFLSNTRIEDDDPLDTEFTIVSRFGIIQVASSFLVCGVYLAWMLARDPFLKMELMYAVYSLFLLVFLCGYLMRRSTYNAEVKRRNAVQKFVETNGGGESKDMNNALGVQTKRVSIKQ